MISEIAGWLGTVLAITGAVINAQRRVEGFYLWVIANIIFMVLAARRGDLSQVMLWVTYTVISLHGIVEWQRKIRKESRDA